MNTLQTVRMVGKPLIFLLCLLPAALVVGDALGISGQLSANPVEDILDRFGNWAIRFIMMTLAVTPLRRLSGWNWLTRFRRMLGLFTFFYASMHFLTWLLLDRGLAVDPAFQWSVILEDLTERPFIAIGFTALLLLIAMAVTSTNGLRRRMGRNWDKLHYSAYAVGILGVWHYWWQVKKDTSDAWIYAVILAVLLGLRLYWRIQRASRR
ncbi:MAG: sulfoxide reductase heme-binding subunit YedZ [Gammaproteobacteria bacterium]|nr:sulfoxide reductase heme-binding subunit YedZ [Gammaproteobacteria bacterium]